MSDHYHAIVWIDKREAKVFHLGASEVDHMILHPHNPTRHIRHTTNTAGNDEDAFFEQVVEGVQYAKAILISGPSDIKSELASHLKRHHPKLASRIVGIETIAHPCDGALVAVARLCFTGEVRSSSQSLPANPDSI